MPCDSIVLNQIDFTTAKGHESLLAEALRAAGYTVSQAGNSLSFYKGRVSGSYYNGKFNVEQGSAFNVDEVKQHFGKTVVKTAAKKFGWSFTEKSDGKIQIRKRS